MHWELCLYSHLLLLELEGLEAEGAAVLGDGADELVVGAFGEGGVDLEPPSPRSPAATTTKLTRYLLVKRPRGDKSGYLALAGFSADNSSALRTELLALAARGDAKEQETDQFGTRYRLEGVLSGPNGVELSVATIWLRKADGCDHFVTLLPRRGDDDAT